MTNLSVEDLKNLGISEGEINQYEQNGLWYLALQIVGWRGNFTEYTKGTDKLYPKETPKAVELIKVSMRENNFDKNKTIRKLEKRFEKIEENRPRIREKI